ncbi:hypothetical protein HYPSUDRAFT_164247 [Hypholoma sublateritium FD-334 SS-4]|uniref:DUF6589 domain-containing protein n=1 Tax=Hypholoma sublateritium (strain FD-334 SS-4) TaxID=945553 RepID=A0A0D2P1T2_HYPSF|nr:hypothetical protein HYPSUDRAFT_164247 [Hypholoma sublateritium FD-334 SS-4]
MRNKRLSKADTLLRATDTLSEAGLSPLSLLIGVLEADNNDNALSNTRRNIFRPKNKGALVQILDLIMADRQGAETLNEWMLPHAVTLVCETIHTEMEAAKPFLHMTTAETTPEFIESWDINKIMDPISENTTPTWSTILSAATESKVCAAKAARENNKNSQVRHTTRNIISAQVHYRRSFHSSKVQIGLGLMAWSTGARKNLINVLHKAGISTAYSTVANTILALHKYSVEQAAKVSCGPHAFCYDNINISTSIHIEQRPGAMSKMQSGTFPVIYQLDNVDPFHLKLAPIIENFKKSKPLTMSDLRSSRTAQKSYEHQTNINIVHILLKHCTVVEFKKLIDHPSLQHLCRSQLPKGRKTQFYPIAVATIEEASVTGNLQVHDNVYIEQLGHDPETLGEYAIPTLNDQLTNARIRGAQALRAKDVNAWERREVFQLGFGIFHLIMNYIWLILQKHRGTITEHGSLASYFGILEKARLGSDKPDYYTLLAALTQIIDGLIVNAWRTECGVDSLEEYAAKNPTPADILRTADKIRKAYSVPIDTPPTVETTAPRKRKGQAAGNAELDPAVDDNTTDHTHSNTVLLTRDLLYAVELINAVSSGDFGRVEDILPQIACVFRGGGSNNYSMEILHLLHNIKEVWTPEFADIMRNIMLVNPSGLSGHHMPIDLNIEHLIGYLKALFAAKGLYSSWDRLGDISAAVKYLQLIKKRVAHSLASGYQGTSHKTPDTSVLVMRVANHAKAFQLQEYVKNRETQSRPTPDLRKLGYGKFESTSLAAFNKKIDTCKNGNNIDTETGEADELPQADFLDRAEEVDDDITIEE